MIQKMSASVYDVPNGPPRDLVVIGGECAAGSLASWPIGSSTATACDANAKADYYEFYIMTANEKPARVKVDPHGKVLYPEEKTAAKNRTRRE